MISVQMLYASMDEFKRKIEKVDKEKECLVQIFTTILQPEECVALAQEVKKELPCARIIGSSVNGVIYRGQQFDQHTMIIIEQYKNAKIGTYLFSTAGKSAKKVALELQKVWSDGTPKLLRLFLGAYYDRAHQMMERINENMPGMQVVGGMSGELYQSDVLPFVFNEKEALAEGLVCAGLLGEFSTYNRVNTAHERISAVYTITKTDGRAICEIEGQTAQSWLQRNLGFKSTQQYDTWEDIADNDPLVRFQIALEDWNNATRYVRYDKTTQQITQYFSRLEDFTKFRISYTSPAKCVAECKETCVEVMETPMEQLFCYSCLFRKLYLKNCAQWELSPYHKNPVSGVFLLGEFGYQDGVNELLNGSCVLSGICDEEHYLQVDLGRLDQLDSIQGENEGLFDFLVNKQTQVKSIEHRRLLSDVMTHEREHQPDFYRYIDTNLNLHNILKYNVDRVEQGFNKVCLVRVENADILISFIGQAGYYSKLKEMIAQLENMWADKKEPEIFMYSGNFDTIILAASDNKTKEEFLEMIERIEGYCDRVQDKFIGTPIILRFVVFTGSEYLLEQAYNQLELNKNSQARMIVHDAQVQDKTSTRKELERINLIQYAIAQNQVIPYYQGLYNNETKKIDKYEALMRICDQEGSMVTPYYFMEISKKYRLYLDLNLKMLEAVFDDFSKIDCAVNINLCAHDVDSPRFRHTLRQRLQEFHSPQNITFEILEDEYFSDMNVLKEFIAEMRSYGANIAIDDFGSGYSNLLEIVKIKPDYLKIDGQIIREAHKSYEHEMIVGFITTLSKQLDIKLVAEFVENQEIQEVVEKYGILHSQGYFFSKPQPFSDVCQVEKCVDR